MENFLQLFGTMVAFTYHCFDRIVIRGYLSMLSRPEHIVYFFRDVLGIPCITKEVLAKRTVAYQNWVESYARNHAIPIEWAEKDVRKEDRVRPRPISPLVGTMKKPIWSTRFIRTNTVNG